MTPDIEAIYKNWEPQSTSFNDIRFPTTETERLREQALMTVDVDRRHLSSLALRKSLVCLDIGCGVGIQSFLIADTLRPSRVLGVDANSGYIQMAQKIAQKMDHQEIQFQQMDAIDLDLPDSSVDFAFIRLLLQHVNDSDAVLTEVGRVLRPGGRILLIDTDGSAEISPQNSTFDAMFQAYEQWISQRPQGGNRKIGANLTPLLVSHKFSNVVVTKELFDFDKEKFKNVVLDIFPPIKDRMIQDGILAVSTFDENMQQLAVYGQTQLNRLVIPLFYATGTKAT